MEKRRVVITGLGVFTALGDDVDTFYNNLLEGKSGISEIESFDTSEFAVKIAGEIKNYDPLQYFERNEVKRLDKFTQFAMIAAKSAVEDSGIEFTDIDKDRCGVITGCGIGGLKTCQNNHDLFRNKGARRVSPLFIPMMIPDMAPAKIAMMWKLKGPNYSISSACASSGHAIGDALKNIQYNDADIMITGGAEAVITELAVAGFANMKATSRWNDRPKEASRPFDIDRNGFVMGEGAGMLVFEELEHAKKRGAKIYAEIVSTGSTCDAYDMVMPDESGAGAAKAMQIALKKSNCKLEDVALVNTHGTSTPRGDIAEIKAIKAVFGEHAYKLSVNSTKSMLGHLLGAAAAVEFIATVKAVQTDKIHPTINLDNQDPQCDLDCTPNKMVERKVDAALCNAFGFGGHNSSILVTKYKG